MYKDFKVIANLGDVNSIDHGGFFVLENISKTEDSYIEVWVEPEPYEKKLWKVYRWDIETFVFDEETLKEVASNHEPFFSKDLKSIATSCGLSELDLVIMFCSDDLVERAMAYSNVVGYWGPDTFDNDPLKLTYKEINKRYKELEKVMVK